ncbi:MAG: 23S rRNA (adenine(1618)-N(6))-methyltransferase RlmF [Candidatus Saccharibacteria bacterium]
MLASNDKSKSLMHPRNPHRSRYDFKLLIKACPELEGFVQANKFNTESIDFANPEAVRTLNKALLKQYYNISFWEIPENYLCPPIPGRADYIHHMADLLAIYNKGTIPTGSKVKVLDIGTGASCIYPIIGVSSYGWHFVASDVDPAALQSARQIISSNASLKGAVECRLQSNPSNIFSNIVRPKEVFAFSMCNPPFYASAQEALEGNRRKSRNLTGNDATPSLNFGGKSNELYYEGGEAEFVRRMIKQSSEMPHQCLWFSSLVSQKSNLYGIYKSLKKVKATQVHTIEMGQGQKQSRIVAWSFLSDDQNTKWFKV